VLPGPALLEDEGGEKKRFITPELRLLLVGRIILLDPLPVLRALRVGRTSERAKRAEGLSVHENGLIEKWPTWQRHGGCILVESIELQRPSTLVISWPRYRRRKGASSHSRRLLSLSTSSSFFALLLALAFRLTSLLGSSSSQAPHPKPQADHWTPSNPANRHNGSANSNNPNTLLPPIIPLIIHPTHSEVSTAPSTPCMHQTFSTPVALRLLLKT